MIAELRFVEVGLTAEHGVAERCVTAEAGACEGRPARKLRAVEPNTITNDHLLEPGASIPERGTGEVGRRQYSSPIRIGRKRTPE